MNKQKTRHAKSTRITTRFHDSEIEQIKADMKKKKMNFAKEKSAYIRAKVLK